MKSKAHTSWQGTLFEGSGTATLNSGAGGPFPVSWASRTEEAAGKTSPEELIAAAHAACYSMALSNMLAGADHPAENLDTSAVATFERTDAGMRITKMEITVVGTVPGMSAQDFATHAAAAKDGCPVSNALKGNVEIVLDATLS
ncbi:MAG: OsmC family peroxiredoxin [Acidimicrobiia bacterium]|nr:OsmC family peroxiredoxin [Acidimicrobiia bacterium]